MTLHNCDVMDGLRRLSDASVNCCVTSPPYYGLRDYGNDGQIGLEPTPDAYVVKMVEVFREVRRVLRDDGTLWLNLGDSYSAGGRGGGAEGSKQASNGGTMLGEVFTAWSVPGFRPKNLLGIPWRVAFALQADGWYLRQDIIWHKPNPMPESVRDRCTKAHEYLFLLSKSDRYWFDSEAMKEKAVGNAPGNRTHKQQSAYEEGDSRLRTKAGIASYCERVRANPELLETRNRRSVWTIPTRPYTGAHFAVMPEDLVKPCILAGSPPDGTILDPFAGSGTVLACAKWLGRRHIGIELNPDYCKLIEARLAERAHLFDEPIR